MKLLSLISRNGALLYENVCCNCFYKLIHRYSYSKSKSKKKKTKNKTGFAVSFVIEYYSLSILSNAILTLWPESVNLLLYMKFCP